MQLCRNPMQAVRKGCPLLVDVPHPYRVPSTMDPFAHGLGALGRLFANHSQYCLVQRRNSNLRVYLHNPRYWAIHTKVLQPILDRCVGYLACQSLVHGILDIVRSIPSDLPSRLRDVAPCYWTNDRFLSLMVHCTPDDLLDFFFVSSMSFSDILRGRY